MKKLFVLFLLVALVPFTVGCSLWGSDNDDNAVYNPAWTVKVTTPATGLNLRASSPVGTTYEGYKIIINGVELPIIDVTGTVLTFQKLIETALDEANRTAALTAGATVVVTITSPAGVVKTFTYTAKALATANQDVTIDYSTGVPVVVVGGISVESFEKEDTIASVTGMNGTTVVTLGATAPTAANVVAVDNVLTFTIEATTNSFKIVKTPANYSYKVTVNGKSVTGTGFNFAEKTEASKLATITVPTTGREQGKAYEVEIEYIIVDGIKFTAPNAYQFMF